MAYALFCIRLNQISQDVFSLHIRSQNAALVVRRPTTSDFVQFEVFEVLPPISTVVEAEGKLLCTYPGPAISVPMDAVPSLASRVRTELVRLGSTLATSLAESVRPKSLSELLERIVSGPLHPAVVDRITKHIGDVVLLDLPGERSWHKPWRRSPLWLILRVSLQSSLYSCDLYKPFILFFHAHLLHTCLRRGFPSELLYIMRAKLARRLSKLGPATLDGVYQVVHIIVERTEELLQARWNAFQNTGSILPTLQLNGLNFVADTNLSLDNSLDYLTKMLRSPSRDFSQISFTPSHTFRLNNIQSFFQFADGQLANAIAKDPYVSIADFELSVERNLQSWLATTTNHAHTVEVIASCIQQYFSDAKRLYGANAEDNSIMILTIMDLWVVLDRFAIKECPLLKEYSPEIPSGFLHCLLLHRSSSMNRASYIEDYLLRRHKEALKVPSIFSNEVCDTCFAVKYFRTSRDLQRLYDEINMHAQQERAKKLEGLSSLGQLSSSLLFRASKMDHEQCTDIFGRESHSATCQRCQLEDEAKALKIRVHEWPLPLSLVHAQLTVFELSPPSVFSAWREITYTILRDIGLSSVPHSKDHPRVLLDLFSGLERWAPQHRKYRRVTIASTTNSVSSHVVAIPAGESSVLADNGLSFRLFDRTHQSWMIESFSKSSPAALCTPINPKSSPYNHLHHFVSGTGHTPNEIIAAQADRPDGINPHEFMAFSSLRCGPHLQWLNIARELASLSLSFNREEVHTLITQTAWQLGPLSTGVREWHVDLSISSFVKVLLSVMKSRLEKIKVNWQEEVTVRTIGMTNTSGPRSHLICYQFLFAAVFYPQQRIWTSMDGRVHYCGRLET
jgi:hypothetical protein